ncbi:hypothetical protein LJC06_00600 [Bacteroidales bacterium OttesenSCG-928-I14]|nr:hypothetical protein [Bacteroidales bacterium OttesenSCG-928-I14]
MASIDDIFKYNSVSFVGLAKNAGKTTCLNYIIDKARFIDKQIAVTSIGLDGESTDQVTQTSKPEIEIYEGMIFITSEKHFREKRLTAEILDVSDEQTSLGRLVFAKAVTPGKVILSGPADTCLLKKCLSHLRKWNTDTVLVDGALSRLSLASPTVTDAMILVTGAAVAKTIPELVRKTKYVYDRICLETVDDKIREQLADISDGLWSLDKEGRLYNLDIPSVFMIEKYKDRLFEYGTSFFVPGVLSDNFLEFLRIQKNTEDMSIIVKDFSRIFVKPEVYYSFLRKGGKIKVLWKNKLLGLCMNPDSPEGYRLDKDLLKKALEEELKISVYNVRDMLN